MSIGTSTGARRYLVGTAGLLGAAAGALCVAPAMGVTTVGAEAVAAATVTITQAGRYIAELCSGDDVAHQPVTSVHIVQTT